MAKAIINVPLMLKETTVIRFFFSLTFRLFFAKVSGVMFLKALCFVPMLVSVYFIASIGDTEASIIIVDAQFYQTA